MGLDLDNSIYLTKKPYKASKSKKGQKLPKGWQDAYFDYLSCLDSKQKDQSDYLPVVCCLKLFGIRLKWFNEPGHF